LFALWPERCAGRVTWIARFRHQREAGIDLVVATLRGERERLEIVVAIQPAQQDGHRAFAAQADAPDHVVGGARVVMDRRRLTRLQYSAGALH
jgi:hypothetical protein